MLQYWPHVLVALCGLSLGYWLVYYRRDHLENILDYGRYLFPDEPTVPRIWNSKRNCNCDICQRQAKEDAEDDQNDRAARNLQFVRLPLEQCNCVICQKLLAKGFRTVTRTTREQQALRAIAEASMGRRTH